MLISPDLVDICTPKSDITEGEPILNVPDERFPNLARRRAILPLYPTSNRSSSEAHPLLANIPRMHMSIDTGSCCSSSLFLVLAHRLSVAEALHRPPTAWKPAFDVVDHDSTIPSLLRAKYQLYYGDLIRRLQVDLAILDFNYTRLDQYMKRLIEEQIRVFTLRSDEIPRLDEREYPLAL